MQEFLSGENKMLVPGVCVPAPVFKGLALGQTADACVYLPTAPEVDSRAAPDGWRSLKSASQHHRQTGRQSKLRRVRDSFPLRKLYERNPLIRMVF